MNFDGEALIGKQKPVLLWGRGAFKSINENDPPKWLKR